jgi:hypothetical protein
MALINFNHQPHMKGTVKNNLLLWIVVGSGLIGCSSNGPMVTPTQISAPALNPTLSETESVIETITVTEIHLYDDPLNDEIVAAGLLENDSYNSWGDIQVEVRLYNSANSVVDERMTQPTLSSLAPGEVSPFFVRFPNSIQADHAEAVVIHTEPSIGERIDFSVTELETRAAADGMIEIFGEIKNLSYGHAAIENAGVVIFDENDPIIEFVPITLRQTYINPRGSTPFIVRNAPQNAESSREYFVSVIEIDEPDTPAISILEEPVVHYTAQGTPYLIGTLSNASNRAQWASALALVEHDGRFAYMFDVSSPIPLAPDEKRPFHVDLSEIAPLLDEGSRDGELAIQWIVDPVQSREAQKRPAYLDLDIDQIETIGSTVYYRGSISNPYDVEIESPSILGALRTVNGDLVSAGWAQPARKLNPGEIFTFTLALDLSEGSNSWDLEIDLQALGVVQ